MTYKLIFSPEFSIDLDNMFDYISQTLSSPKAASALMKEIDDAIVRLKLFPKMYPICKEPLDVLDYRKIIIKNHIIIYSVNDSKHEIYLLRCFYGKSDYVKFF